MSNEPVNMDADDLPLTTIRPDGEIVETPRALTPADSKANAVDALLAQAMPKASQLPITKDEMMLLKKDFGDECFRPGAAGKENLLYLEYTHLRNRMDEAIGMGQWAFIPRARWTEQKGEKCIKVYVEGFLIVRGCYVNESVGDMDYYTNNASTNHGDAIEGAASAALRRCCKNFGVGLQPYSKTWCDGWYARRGAPGNRQAAATASPDDAAAARKLFGTLAYAVDQETEFAKWASRNRVDKIDSLTPKEVDVLINELNRRIAEKQSTTAGKPANGDGTTVWDQQLQNAAQNGTAALERAWKEIGKDGRLALKDKIAGLKQEASQHDANVGDGDAKE